jgi:Na+/H+ antiporter NhaD/arsenite permease-like protein
MGLIKETAVVAAALLALFYVLDSMYARKETPAPAAEGGEKEPLRVDGLYNLIFLGGIMGAVLLSGIWNPHVEFSVLGIHVALQSLVRDLIIIAMGLLSLKFTPWSLREANEFTWDPIKEVGYLFAGIFMTIVPALAILKAGEHGALAFVVQAANSQASYFWISGGLSSFLDNAPTYLTFFTSALGKLGLEEATIAQALRMAPDQWHTLGVAPEILHQFESYLVAIALGSVYMGSNTYIGNAPNFMVKSIAEQNGVVMPSFFGYMAWSICILIPTFLVVTLVVFV